MKLLKYLFYLLLGIAVLVGGLGLFAKKSYHIERSIVIDAPKAMVYDQIRFFKNFHEWSPWSKFDTTMTLTYGGTDGEVGATYGWKGNDDVGEGVSTITAVTPDRIDWRMDIVRPLKTTIPSYFNISGNDEKSSVTWAIELHLPFPSNVWAMFTDIDNGMGIDYAHGLGFLKRRCEGMAHKKYHGYEVAETDLPDTHYLSARKVVPFEEIGDYFAEFLPQLQAVVDTEKLTLVGSPSGLYWTYDMEKKQTDMAVALPIKEAKKQAHDFEMYKIKGGKALIVDYLGDYSMIADAHLAMDDYMAGNRLRNIPPVIEAYVAGPASEPDTTKWVTKVIYFVEPMPDTALVKK
jgi:effector-binding domain-containing protein